MEPSFVRRQARNLIAKGTQLSYDVIKAGIKERTEKQIIEN
jgi:hypothetical protein